MAVHVIANSCIVTLATLVLAFVGSTTEGNKGWFGVVLVHIYIAS